MKVEVGGRTFHSERLRQQTGIDASENQARVILSDLNYYLAKHGSVSASGKSVGTFKWLTTSFEPVVAPIRELRQGNPVQGYCDLFNHRFLLANAGNRTCPTRRPRRLDRFRDARIRCEWGDRDGGLAVTSGVSRAARQAPYSSANPTMRVGTMAPVRTPAGGATKRSSVV